NVPASAYAVTTTVSRFVAPPPCGNDSARPPGSVTEPPSATHREDTSAGTRPTVNAAVNAGASSRGGGQAPGCSARAPVTVTCTDCAGAVVRSPPLSPVDVVAPPLSPDLPCFRSSSSSPAGADEATAVLRPSADGPPSPPPPPPSISA